MPKKSDKAGTLKLEGIADSLSKALGKRFKNYNIPISDEGAEFTKVTDWVSTGCQILDLAISNIPYGGLPCGRLSILYGPEQSGKSLLAAQAIASTQKMGGLGVYIDTEMAFHEGFFNAIGVDTSSNNQWLYIPENSLEAILTIIEQTIHDFRKENPDALLTIVLDSYAGSSTEEEKAGDFSLKGYNTSKAIIIKDGLTRLMKLIAQENVCFIITNQVKYKMNPQPFEDPWRMPGGQSLPHFASVIIKLAKAKPITTEINNIKREIGRYATAVTKKNRLAPPNIKVSFSVFYDRGVDNYGAWLDYMSTFKIGSHSGAWVKYKYTDPDTGEVQEFKEHGKLAFARNVLEVHEGVRNEIWEQICDKFIMAYAAQSAQLSEADIQIVDDEEAWADE